ncbi:MAG: ABC-F family ATP-binding cassette domain-containing protein [Pseudomonadota bacterium]
MSSHIELRDVSWSTPDGSTLLDNINLSFGAERTGLIGRNGIGKTTLLRIMAGEIAPTSGTFHASGTISMLHQQSGPPATQTIADTFAITAALERLVRIESGATLDGDLDNADWTVEPRAMTALADAGLSDIALDRQLDTLSGGQATRVALAALMFTEPDLLLLDEPTNNLDKDGRAIVADMLSAWKGGAVVVSHDRELLRRMDRIVELSGLGARVYGGNWDLYAERKAEERDAAEHRLAVAERHLVQVNREIQQATERKARSDSRGRHERTSRSHSKSAYDFKKEKSEQSMDRGTSLTARKREEATAAVTAAREDVEVLRSLNITLPSSNTPSNKRLLTLEEVCWRTPDGKTVLSDVSLTLVGPERLAVTGPNGAGKSTLLRLVTGDLECGGGTVRRGCRIVMLDQNVALLDPGLSILENFRHLNPDQPENTARAMLARFLFRNDAALKRVEVLSGGERLRAALAVVLGGHEAPQLIVLDEPTNHLDLDSIAVIEAALADFDGALLVASHDEDFLSAIRIERRIDLGEQR